MSEPESAEDLPRVEREEDHPVFIHVCNGRSRRTWLPLGAEGWQWTGEGGLAPSIHCQTCGTHGFWVGGDVPAWRSC